MKISEKIEEIREQLEAYDRQKTQIVQAIEERFRRYTTLIDLDGALVALEYDWVETVELLQNLASNIESERIQLLEQVEELAELWEEHEDKDELPPEPPSNDPSLYDQGLFD